MFGDGRGVGPFARNRAFSVYSLDHQFDGIHHAVLLWTDVDEGSGQRVNGQLQSD